VSDIVEESNTHNDEHLCPEDWLEAIEELKILSYRLRTDAENIIATDESQSP
jgi:hypothetical protein